MAALRSGITTVLLPAPNMVDVEEIPREIKRKMTFVPVEHMRDVIAFALERDPCTDALEAPSRSTAAATASST